MLRNDRTVGVYEDKIESALPKLESLGFDRFRSELPEHEDPSGFQQQNGDTNYVPDIVAIRNGKKSYIEIAKKTHQHTKLVSKWKLLSTLAQMNKAFFGIVTPRGTIKYTKEILDSYNISANLIRI